MVMTEEQIQLVKATAPVFKDLGVTITTRFYENIFEEIPALKNVFNMSHQKSGSQINALANAVFAYAAYIDNLGALSAAVSRICHKHASLMVQPEHYPIVGRHLLRAVKEVLGDAVDDQTMEAWRLAYNQLADIFIGVERDLYYNAQHVAGGWSGWRKFRIARKEAESELISSFYLEPVDGADVPLFKPGQYVSIKRFVPELGLEQPRQYSLSSSPQDGGAKGFLRISVKREMAHDGTPAGSISSILHDQVAVGEELDVSPPMGDFFMETMSDTPVVLISAGVGVTPLLSMLGSIVGSETRNRRVSFVHAARDRDSHVFGKYVSGIVEKHENVSKSIWYGDCSKGGVQGVDYDHAGRIQLSQIREMVVLPEADYYLCGPSSFMTEMDKQLKELGVPTEKIHSQQFDSL